MRPKASTSRFSASQVGRILKALQENGSCQQAYKAAQTILFVKRGERLREQQTDAEESRGAQDSQGEGRGDIASVVAAGQLHKRGLHAQIGNQLQHLQQHGRLRHQPEVFWHQQPGEK